MPTWKDFTEEILNIAKDLGVDSKEVVFEEVPVRVVNRLAAQAIPFAPEHWSRGRRYIMQQSSHDRGEGIIYELVFNFTPARAYISQEYSDPVKTLTVAHVLGHGHIFKHNVFERDVTHLDKILSSYVDRIAQYERKYGFLQVEEAIDLAIALAPSVNSPTKASFKRHEEDGLEELAKPYLDAARFAVNPDFDPLLHRDYTSRVESKLEQSKLEKLLNSNLVQFFTQDHSELLPEWVSDIVKMEGIIYKNTHYSHPLKFLHEGFSSWVHTHIVPKLQLPPEWRIELSLSLRGSSKPFFFIPRLANPNYDPNDDDSYVLHILPNPYGFGLAMMSYLESIGKHPPEEVKKHSDFSLFYEYGDEEFFFGFLPSLSPYVPSSPFPEGDNFYSLLSNAYLTISDLGEEFYLNSLYKMYRQGASWYRLLLGFVVLHALEKSIEDPLEAFRSFVLSFVSLPAFPSPRVYAVDPLELHSLPAPLEVSREYDPLYSLCNSVMSDYFSGYKEAKERYGFPRDVYILHVSCRSMLLYTEGKVERPKVTFFLHPFWVQKPGFFSSFSHKAFKASGYVTVSFYMDDEDEARTSPPSTFSNDYHFYQARSAFTGSQTLYMISEYPLDPAYACGVLSLIGRHMVKTREGMVTDLVLISPILPD